MKDLHFFALYRRRPLAATVAATPIVEQLRNVPSSGFTPEAKNRRLKRGANNRTSMTDEASELDHLSLRWAMAILDG
jgi:hypothetical protein